MPVRQTTAAGGSGEVPPRASAGAGPPPVTATPAPPDEQAPPDVTPEPPNEVQSIFSDALARGQGLAGATTTTESGREAGIVHDQPGIAGKQLGASEIHRDVASRLREEGADDLADAFDVYADAGEAMAEVYSGDRSVSELSAIDAQMAAAEQDIEELADDHGLDEEAVDDLLGI